VTAYNPGLNGAGDGGSRVIGFTLGAGEGDNGALVGKLHDPAGSQAERQRFACPPQLGSGGS